MSRKQTKKPRITMTDVARAAGVSPMTVSKALSRTGRISDETRERVSRVAVELGYVPNRFAGSLSSQTSEIVAVILPSINDEIYGDVISEINEVLRPRGLLTFIGESLFDSLQEEELVQTILSLHPAGIIIAGGIHRTQTTQKALDRWDCPVVQIWDDIDTSFEGTVSPDHLKAGRLIADHFLEKGFRAPAYVGAELDKDICAARRCKAFLDAMKGGGRSTTFWVDNKLPRQWSSGRTLAEALMHTHPETDAIYCLNDAMALGVISWLYENGYSVPGDVAVAGFNGTSLSHVVRTRLTTVQVDCRTLGRIAANTLLSMLDGDRSTVREMLPTELVVGNTT